MAIAFAITIAPGSNFRPLRTFAVNEMQATNPVV
jgi:hypothetical protein